MLSASLRLPVALLLWFAAAAKHQPGGPRSASLSKSRRQLIVSRPKLEIVLHALQLVAAQAGKKGLKRAEPDWVAEGGAQDRGGVGPHLRSLRLRRALVGIGLSLGARAVVELDELRVKAREPAQGARIAFGVGRALRGLAFGIGGHALLQMDHPLVERFEQPADDVAPAELLDGRALYLGFACGAGFGPGFSLWVPPSRTQPFFLARAASPRSLTPCASAMRLCDQSPWTKSCLALSQSGRAVWFSSVIC